MQSFPTNPISAIRSHWQHRDLIVQLTKREILGRYRGSALGSIWSVINPLLLLAIYTFVFSSVFKSRWPGMHSESKFDFALILFAGLIPFNFFCELLARSPNLIIANSNYVKRIVFPLEILPSVALLAAAFHAIINLAALLIFQFAVHRSLHPTLFYSIPIMLSLSLATLGVAWLLSAIGAYFRDLGQIIGMATTILMFLSPIFYPTQALPEAFQRVVHLNPLTWVIEAMRSAILWGAPPSIEGSLIYLFFSLIIATTGYWLFQKARTGFSDVL